MHRLNSWDNVEKLRSTAQKTGFEDSCFATALKQVTSFAEALSCSDDEAYHLLLRLDPIQHRGFVTSEMGIPFADALAAISWTKKIVPIFAWQFKEKAPNATSEQLTSVIATHIRNLNPAPTPHYINIDQLSVPKKEEWTIDEKMLFYLKLVGVNLRQINHNPNRAVRVISITAKLLEPENDFTNPMCALIHNSL